MATTQTKKKQRRGATTRRKIIKSNTTINHNNNNNNDDKRRKLAKRQQLLKNSNNKINNKNKIKNKKKKHQKQQQQLEKLSSTPSSSSNEFDSDKQIQALLEPYSKDQLLEFLCDAAVTDQYLLARIKEIADRDVSHRKIFVYGLGWDATQQTLLSAFQSYGEIEDCKVVLDRVTGKAKGYGFVLFKSRNGAMNALKQPQKKIGNRMASCQLASVGPFSPNQSQETMARKIYVSNVHADVDPEKLRIFFAKFGELEAGPLGFDMLTGKSRGFALFVYKTIEGVKKALEEPHKMFEGHQLNCQRASENKHKFSPVVQQQQQHQQHHQHQQIQQQQITQQQAPMLAAMAAAQNLALFSQHPSLNPAYSVLAMNSNSGLVPGGAVNPLVAGALNQNAISSAQVQGASFGTQIPGSSIGASAGLGAYGASHGLGALGAHAMNPALQGLQSYHGSQLGHSSASRTLGTAGSLPGYSSYL